MNSYWILGASHGMPSARPCGEGATAFDQLALGMRTGREWPDRQLYEGNWTPPERPECFGDMQLDIGPESVSADPGSAMHAGGPDLVRAPGTGPGICGHAGVDPATSRCFHWEPHACTLDLGHPDRHECGCSLQW